MKGCHHRLAIHRIWPLFLGVFAILSLAVTAHDGESLLSLGTNATAGYEQQVRSFIAAFNARDIDQMIGAVDEKIQWVSVEGAKINVETEGKAALKESMTAYFRSCPSCRSSLEWVQSAGSRVTALERASWTGKSGPVSQTSLSVYEFSNAGIIRVYYFPAERDSQPRK